MHSRWDFDKYRLRPDVFTEKDRTRLPRQRHTALFLSAAYLPAPPPPNQCPHVNLPIFIYLLITHTCDLVQHLASHRCSPTASSPSNNSEHEHWKRISPSHRPFNRILPSPSLTFCLGRIEHGARRWAHSCQQQQQYKANRSDVQLHHRVA